uniref:Protein kinase domain-containing protein n=2 Tax=Corethron hystrix TaxID=216773 RepID=A0A7S1FJU8_9STRA|mmetsp:Transcript_10177/g.22578  ORF Transcript_10177/g.22578 Transcript_10177/m.22578 type:complete len:570 (+) Transcript_10177:105-1814(+)
MILSTIFVAICLGLQSAEALVSQSVSFGHDLRHRSTHYYKRSNFDFRTLQKLGSSRKSSGIFSTVTDSPSNTRSERNSAPRRSQQEFRSLLQDILAISADAGPQATVRRSIQAYAALRDTVRDFAPAPIAPLLDGPFGLLRSGNYRRAPEKFSAPVALRKLFEKLGATYVKLGQFVASSPTLFPPDYVVEFQKCLDKTDPIEWSVIKQIIEAELGPISRSFSHVDPEPLASASIAQVHAARLITGEDVVIKVQRPGIGSALKADLSFVYVASRIVEFLQPDFERTSLSAIAGDIRKSMLEELDFTKEATNVEEFREFLDQNGISEATAPKIYRDLTTKKCMTMERLRGVSLLDKDSIQRITNNSPESTIITALNVWTMSVMTMPWFHADVHAGNLLVLEDGRVGFIDFGIVGRVGEKTWKAVNELSGAMGESDFEAMARAMCNMGATDEEVDVKKFGRDIEKVMTKLSAVQPEVTVSSVGEGAVEGSIGFDEEELTKVLLEIVEVTENNGLKLPREFGLLVKQSLYFDRYLKILAPGLDVMADSRVTMVGTDESPRSSFSDPDKVIIDV